MFQPQAVFAPFEAARAAAPPSRREDQYRLELGINANPLRSFLLNDNIGLASSLTQVAYKHLPSESRRSDWTKEAVTRFAKQIPLDPQVIEARASLLLAMVEHDEVFNHISKGLRILMSRGASAPAVYAHTLVDSLEYKNLVARFNWFRETPEIEGVSVLSQMRSFGEALEADKKFTTARAMINLLDQYQYENFLSPVLYKLYPTEPRKDVVTLCFNRVQDVHDISRCAETVTPLLQELIQNGLLDAKLLPTNFLEEFAQKTSQLKASLAGQTDREALVEVIAGLDLSFDVLKTVYNSLIPAIFTDYEVLKVLWSFAQYYREESKQGKVFIKPVLGNDLNWEFSDVVNQSLKFSGEFVTPYSIKFSAEQPLNVITGGCSSGKSEMVRDILRTCAQAQLGLLEEATTVRVPILDNIFYYPVGLDQSNEDGGWFEQNIRPGVEIIFGRATPRSLLVLDEFGTIGTDTSDMKDLLAPAYHLIRKAGITTLHCTHFRDLARAAAQDRRSAIFSMGIDDRGNNTRQPVRGQVAESNAVQVAERLGLTMQAAETRLRQLKIS